MDVLCFSVMFIIYYFVFLGGGGYLIEGKSH